MLVSLNSPTQVQLSSVHNYNIMSNCNGTSYSIILNASKLSVPRMIRVPIKNSYLEQNSIQVNRLNKNKPKESKRAVAAKNSLVDLMSSIPGIEPPKSL